MNQEEVVALMKSSRTSQEWNTNCDKVKETFGGDYPEFWYAAIVLSGVASETSAKWGGSANIRMTGF